MRGPSPADPACPVETMPRRLREDEIASVLHALPEELHELALELRGLILRIGPQLDEEIAFHSICYTVPGRPYGVISGNVCVLSTKRGVLQLGFLHGACLPDTGGLLQGTGKAKRHIEWEQRSDVPLERLEPLIRAAIAYDPSA